MNFFVYVENVCLLLVLRINYGAVSLGSVTQADEDKWFAKGS